MAKVALKHIIGSKKELYKVVTALISQLNTTVWIEDETGKLLYGEKKDTNHSSYPVILDEEIVAKMVLLHSMPSLVNGLNR